jgi:hypothetical protein
MSTPAGYPTNLNSSAGTVKRGTFNSALGLSHVMDLGHVTLPLSIKELIYISLSHTLAKFLPLILEPH